MSSTTTTVKALVLTPSTKTVTLRDVPKPTPSRGEVLIRVEAIALNPVDALFVSQPLAVDDRIIGTDFAGVVEGAHVDLASSSDARTKNGARVAGFLQGACSINLRPGAFAQYITAPYDLVWLVPDHMSLESASTISMCGLTAAQGVFARLGMPAPFPTTPAGAFLPSLSSSDPVNVLIYGASTSLGMYAAQMVRASSRVSGRKIRLIGTASAGKHAFLRAKPYAYDVLIDYRAPDWPAQVAKATAGAGVAYALDTISEGPTVPAIESTLAQQDARMAVFRQPEGGGYDVSKLRIKPIYGAVWEGLGVEVQYSSGLSIPADPAARAFAAAFFEALSDGTLAIMPNPVRLMPGGLANVVADGFVLIGDALFSARGGDKGRTEGHMKPISGEKLVYQVEQ